MYADNAYKWVIVVNRKVSTLQILNAIGHLALTMRVQCDMEAAGNFHKYQASSGELASISHWPVIALQATNSNQLKLLRQAGINAGIPCQAFVETMIGQSAEEQLAKTKSSDEESLEYYAVMVFGCSDDELRPLTKKFSLYTQPPLDTYGRPFHTLDPH